MQKVLLLIVGLAICISCNKEDPNELGPTVTPSPEPIACFDTMKITIPITQSVHFSSCSKNATYHEWSFGDGDSSTDKVVNHKYAEPGTYKATLKVYNSDKNRWDIASKEIKVGYLYVTKVTVMAYDKRDNDGTKNDVFFAFLKDSVIIVKTPTVYNASVPVEWIMDWKFIPGEEIGFGLYDEEIDHNRWLMYRVFDPYQYQYTTVKDTDTSHTTVKLEYTIK